MSQKPKEDLPKQSIETIDIVKRYRKKLAVKGVSFSIKSGEVVGLLGPNGSGKTTSFYITAGIVKPTSGKVLMNGKDVTNLSISIRSKFGIGYLPQESSIFKSMSVSDNILIGLEMLDLTKKERNERLEELLEEFHITHIYKNSGSSLSGGERRRVEIARCLAINPSFILLDEPFAGIDPISISDIESVLHKLRNKNIGVLITDHNIRETLNIMDRGYILIDGNIVTSGSKDDIMSNPLTKEKYLGEKFIIS